MNEQLERWVVRVLPVCMGLACGQIEAAEIKLGDALERVSISGDFRLRQENFNKKTNGQVDRSRQRYRLRLATDFSLPSQLALRLRFASGTGEQVSTNQSFDNLSSQKSIWVDRAFLEWTPRNFARLAAGRMSNPFWTVYTSDAVWDEDFSPEGFSQSAEVLLGGNMRVFGNALQMVVDEDGDIVKDQWMMGEQLGLDFLLGESRIRLAGSYYEWINEGTTTFSQGVANEGNRRTGASPGVLQNDFGVAELTGEIMMSAMGIPVSLQGTYLKNTKAQDSLDPKADTGYQAGFRLGRAGLDRTWEAAYFYKKVQTDATVADVADSDFGDGGTNRKGHIFWVAGNPYDWMQVKAKYFITKVIDESLTPNADDINRLQLDFSVRF